MASDRARPLLESPAYFLGFEIVSQEGKHRRDRRVQPGAGTAVLTPVALIFHGSRLDQRVAIPLADIHHAELAQSHNARRSWKGKILKVSFGGGEVRVLGLHMTSSDALAWRRLLRQITEG